MNQHIGRSSGGRTTKIHAVVDGLGNPLYIKLTAGQIHDSTQAIKILSQLIIKGSNILADKAYGTKEVREYIRKNKGECVNTSEVQCSKQMGMRLPYLQGKTSCGMFFQ